MCVCVTLCVCVCVHACVLVCVCVPDGKRRVFASNTSSIALTVVWTAVYLTGHSDYLTGFREPCLPPNRCHTNLKNF